MAAEIGEYKESFFPIKLLVIFIILAAGILAAGYFYYRGYEKLYRAEVEHTLSAVADLKVSELVQWRSERMADAEVIYKNTTFSNLVRRYLNNPGDLDAEQQLGGWLDEYLKHTEYDQIRLLDSQGTTLMSFPAGRPAASVTIKNAIADVLRSGQITVVDLYRNGHDRRKIYLSVLIPILDVSGNKKPFGVLSLRVDPEKYLFPFVLRWPTPSKTAETILVRRDGNDVLFLNELRFRKNAALNFRIPLTKTDTLPVMAVLGRTGIVEGVDYLGVPVVADICSVPNSPWFLIIRMDTSEMRAPARGQLWIIIGFVAALLFSAGTGLALIWRQQNMRFYRERYQAAEALRENERKLTSITSNMAEGIYVLNETGHIIFMNPEAERLLGWTINEVYEKGPRAHDLVHFRRADGTPLPLEECNMHRVIETGKRFSSTDEVFVRKDGTVFPVSVISAPMVEDGKVVASITVFRDITESKRAEEALKTLNQELQSTASKLEVAYKDMESFSYSVSHDLRAPLRIIKGLSDIVLKDYHDKLDDEGKNLLQLLQNNSQRLDQLVLALLDFSKAGRQEMAADNIDMGKAAKLIAGDLKAMAPERNIDINIGTLPPAHGDLKLIRQVLANLLSNAVKFTRDREVASIEVGSRSADNENIYYVKDNGAGFDMEQENRLFKVFQRLHSLNDFEGTGIGLSIVQRIIQRHGGRVWAEGKPGEGATFYFSLPAEKA